MVAINLGQGGDVIWLRAPGDRDRPFRLIATSRYD
jgi:hypothetical protein